VFKLRIHFIDLIFKSFDLDLFWTNLGIQLFDLEIKHKFELFKLLDFLSQVLDSAELLLQGLLTI
jgi:hypothetical protein